MSTANDTKALMADFLRLCNLPPGARLVHQRSAASRDHEFIVTVPNLLAGHVKGGTVSRVSDLALYDSVSRAAELEAAAKIASHHAHIKRYGGAPCLACAPRLQPEGFHDGDFMLSCGGCGGMFSAQAIETYFGNVDVDTGEGR